MYGDCLTSQDWARDFVTFAEQLQGKLNLTYSHFDCMYWREEKTGLAVKSLRYVKRNMARIHRLLTTVRINGLGFTAATAATDFTRDAECSLGFYCPDPRPGVPKPYYQFSFQVIPEVLASATQQDGTLAFFVALIRKVEKLVNVRYGLIQPMDKEKRGGLYFANVFSEHLSQAERQDLHLWLGSNVEYSRKIRGVYWGNLITDDHLGAHREAVLTKIRDVLGAGSLVKISAGKYFLALPTDILAFSENFKVLERHRLELRQVLAEHSLLM
jgi:hypothetical protein